MKDYIIKPIDIDKLNREEVEAHLLHLKPWYDARISLIKRQQTLIYEDLEVEHKKDRLKEVKEEIEVQWRLIDYPDLSPWLHLMHYLRLLREEKELERNEH